MPHRGPTGRRVAIPYGNWPSSISAELVARQATAYDAVQATPNGVYWLETRPLEHGRTVLVRWTPSSGAVDALPDWFDVGSRVHEYGGGAYLATNQALFVVRRDDQRLYRMDLDQQHAPWPITPAPQLPSGLRYADLRVTSDRRLLICVREDHQTDPSAVRHQLVGAPTDGSAAPSVFAAGHDFYAAPRPSPDGQQLAWLSWNRPQMPWDGTDLWIADLHPDGQLGLPRHVAGGPEESIVQPEWAPGGDLYFLSDRTGWWNLYRCHPPFQNGGVEPLAPQAAEFADPPWELDYSTYAILQDGRIACRYRQAGTDYLALLEPDSGHFDQLTVPYTAIKPYLRAAGQRLALIGATPTTNPAVITLDPPNGQPTVLATTEDAGPIGSGHLSQAQPITFPTSDGQTGHALYYPPTNPDAIGPTDAPPPLLVQAHPGPTSSATNRLELRTQFFTSRGYAVVNVNYAGSSGYGRAYRERLTGQWGILDVADCIHAARRLVALGRADVARLVIAGASAGGYTTLCALAFHEVFAAGTSYFGITDPETFRRQAPDFQAHQLDRLIGPYPQAVDRYHARSPLHHADHISRPVLLLHGLRDTVVPPTQAAAIATALQQRGIPHAYVTFPDEGHGLGTSTSIRNALEAELAFYTTALRIPH